MRFAPQPMNLSRRLFAAIALLLATLAAVPDPALARIAPEEAGRRAQQAYGGRVLSIERNQSGGRTVYRVKLLSANGDLRVVIIDAETGVQR